MSRENIKVDVESKDHWYHKSHRNYQRSLYKLFVEKHKIDIEKVIDVIEEMRIEFTASKPIMLTMIETFCFEELIKRLAEKTGIKFSKRYNKHEYDYDNWWNECNLDGSFAYNGVADDF